MVGYSLIRLLPLAWGESREVQPLWLIGEFSALLAMRLGKFPNKLWYFPLVNIRMPASIPSFTTFSALVFSVAAPSALRIGLASPVVSALPIGARAYRTGIHSSPYTRCNVWTCRKSAPRTLLLDVHRLSVLPCRCQGNIRFWNSQPICPPLLIDWKRSSV